MEAIAHILSGILGGLIVALAQKYGSTTKLNILNTKPKSEVFRPEEIKEADSA